MSARLPRRQFASPFVVTLALTTASTLVTAPSPARAEPTPVGKNPPAHVTTRNPPMPGKSAAATPPIEDVAPAPEKTRWRVEKGPSHCTARRIVEPRACEPGKRCNPPKPLNYDCPAGPSPPFEVVQEQGATACFVNPSAADCTPGATCNPPPPRRVPCPP